MSIISMSLISQNFVLNMILILSLLALIFEVATGGLLFGFFALVGFFFVFNYSEFSWVSFIVAVIGVILVVLEVAYPSRAIFFMLGNALFLCSFFIQGRSLENRTDIVILIISILIILLLVFFFYLGLRKVKSLKYKEGLFSLIGSKGIVLQDVGYAQIEGTRWQIISQEPLVQGDQVVVLEKKDLTLIVKKVV